MMDPKHQVPDPDELLQHSGWIRFRMPTGKFFISDVQWVFTSKQSVFYAKGKGVDISAGRLNVIYPDE